MTTEQMIEELYRVAGKHKNDVVGVGELNLHAMCIDVAKRLQELLDKKLRISEWIPCSERLPEKDGAYLCTMDGELCGEEKPFTGMCGIENDVWDEPENVIAWMPLPEPYNPNTCKNTECPFYCPKQDCVAKEGCGGYTNE